MSFTNHSSNLVKAKSSSLSPFKSLEGRVFYFPVSSEVYGDITKEDKKEDKNKGR